MEEHGYMRDFSIIHRFSIMFHVKALKEFKVAAHQMGYIVHICKEPGVSQEDLSAFFGLNKGSVAKGVRNLVDEGYVRRLRNEKDQRAYRLYPTEKAESLVATAEEIMGNFDDILTKGMTKREKELFQSLLEKACDNVMEAAGDARQELARPGPPPPGIHCCDAGTKPTDGK